MFLGKLWPDVLIANELAVVIRSARHEPVLNDALDGDARAGLELLQLDRGLGQRVEHLEGSPIGAGPNSVLHAGGIPNRLHIGLGLADVCFERAVDVGVCDLEAMWP